MGGAFLKNSVNKNEYLGEYTGELISHREADKRGKIYDRTNSSFLFDLNDQGGCIGPKLLAIKLLESFVLLLTPDNPKEEIQKVEIELHGQPLPSSLELYSLVNLWAQTTE